ncbi:unnamed protein product [Caretta caretta]
MLHSIHFLTFVSHPKWQDLLQPEEEEDPQWDSLYSTLVSWPAEDISWQLLHGAMSTGMYPGQFTNSPDTCPFCSERKTLVQIYIECIRLQPLFQLLQNLLLMFWLHFSLQLLILAYPIHGPIKSWDLFVNLLLVLAKMAIHHTRRRKLVL